MTTSHADEDSDQRLWSDLGPAPEMVTALRFAEQEVTRDAVHREALQISALPTKAERQRQRSSLRNQRKRWSEQFATACATMIANEIRQHAVIRNRFEVRPDAEGRGQETFTPLGYKRGKRIDVVVSGPLVGLQIGVSLKGLNFADDESGNHDKNLAGRLYELRDEVSTVHDHLPRAFMAAVFFMPVAGCFDKTAAAPSSFAHLVAELRARTGRLDPSVGAHARRCDLSAVGMYAPGDLFDHEGGAVVAQPSVVYIATRLGKLIQKPRQGWSVVLPLFGHREPSENGLDVQHSGVRLGTSQPPPPRQEVCFG